MITVADAIIKFRGEDKQLTRDLQETEGRTESFASDIASSLNKSISETLGGAVKSGLNTVTNALGNVAKAFVGVESVAKGAGEGVKGALRGAAGEAEDLEDSASSLRTTLDELREALRNAGEGGEDLGGASDRLKELLGDLEAGLEDAAIEAEDLEEASEALKDALRESAESATETGQSFGQLETGATQGAEGVGRLGGALKNIGLAMGGALLGAIAALVTALAAIGKAALDTSMETQEAARQLQNQFGVTTEEAQRLAETARDIFGEGYGESVTEAANALGEVRRQMKELAEEELEGATIAALKLRDTFGIELPETANSAAALMKYFGLTGQQAFDWIAEAQQRGLNTSGDLLETLGEYSVLMAENGVSAEQFFSILESGLQSGILGTDKAADALKEFFIRIKDGSDTTQDALLKLFAATSAGTDEYSRLTAELESTESALIANKAALEQAEDAFKDSQRAVSELESALNLARQELDKLSTPNLAGMQEYEDQLAALDLQAKQARLAMIDLDRDSPEFKAADQALRAINKEMDRLALERDIQFEPQLRAIRKATEEAAEPAMHYTEVLALIGARKEEIAELEGALAGARDETERNRLTVEAFSKANEEMSRRIDSLKGSLKNASGPARELLEALDRGDIKGIDALQQIQERLRQMPDSLERNQIGVALFGTQWEDMGAEAVLALDLSGARLEDFAGAVDSLNTKSNSLGAVFGRVWREFSLALQPASDRLAQLYQDALPQLERAMQTIATIVGGVLNTAIRLLFGETVPESERAIKELAGGLSQGAEAMENFGALISGSEIQKDVSGWASAFSRVYEFISNIVDTIRNMTPGGIIAALGLTPEQRQIVVDLLATFLMLRDKIRLAADEAVRYFGEKMAELSEWINRNWPEIVRTFEISLKRIVDFVFYYLGAINDYWKEHGDAILAIASNTFESIRNVINAALAIILEVISLIMNLIQRDWQGAWENVKNIIKTVWDLIVKNFRIALNSFWQVLKEMLPTIERWWDNSLKGMNRAIEDFGRTLYNAGVGIVDNLMKGIQSRWGALVDWYSRGLADLRNMLPFSEPKDRSSPLYGLPKAGQAIVANIQQGIRKAGPLELPMLEAPSANLATVGVRVARAVSEGAAKAGPPVTNNFSFESGGVTVGGGGLTKEEAETIWLDNQKQLWDRLTQAARKKGK